MFLVIAQHTVGIYISDCWLKQFKIIQSTTILLSFFSLSCCYLQYSLQCATLVSAFAEFCLALNRTPLTPFLNLCHFMSRFKPLKSVKLDIITCYQGLAILLGWCVSTIYIFFYCPAVTFRFHVRSPFVTLIYSLHFMAKAIQWLILLSVFLALYLLIKYCRWLYQINKKLLFCSYWSSYCDIIMKMNENYHKEENVKSKMIMLHLLF